MRFAIPFSTGRIFRLPKRATDWPLALRFTVLILPAGLCIALLATWMGYKAATTTLAESLDTLPLLEAKAQAEKMSITLKQLRHSLLLIAQQDGLTAQKMRDNASLFFHGNLDVIQEIGFKDTSGNGFMLLRDKEQFRELSMEEASQGAYAPFQQITTLPLVPGGATLYPAVFFYHLAHDGKERTQRVPVMRMAMPLPGGSGVLVLGIGLESWRNRLAVYTRADSPLRSPLQEGAVQLSYFFDASGWMLFEMDSTSSKSFFPDMARHGYTGDLGRPGFDAAFRPWAVHEDFWRMVTEVQANRSGSSPVSAENYASAYVGASGFLCYAPILFSSTEGSAPVPVGGIAFFETSGLPLAAFLRVANASFIISVCALALFGLIALRVGKTLARPFRTMALQLKSMNQSGEFASVEGLLACEEHQKLQAAINSIISRALVMRTDMERIKQEIQYTRARLPVDLSQALTKPPLDAEFDLVGSSSLIREVREQVRKAARAGTDVLVWGETGTGKELVAAAIHKAGMRSSGPYISINCGALDENLLLDALFGHRKGAFTEAKADRKGAFLAADGGTLHLDEIANASFKVQQSLLRALSVRRIRPLGTDAEIPFNTRVVAATNVDLRECVRAGTFREDLYYRLAIISIETPPLRHRKEDIPELAAFCIHEAAASLARPEARLSRGALEIIAAHDWPGNVREFKNCLTRAMAFVEGDLILRQHITLEQDAFRTYGRPLQPQVLAEKAHSPASFPYADPDAPSMEQGQGVSDGSSPSRSASGHAPNHAAEYLWPSPPREFFSPALPLDDTSPAFTENSSSRSGEGGFPGAVLPNYAPVPQAFGTSSPQAKDASSNTKMPEPILPSSPGMGSALQAAPVLNDRQLRALNLVRLTGEMTRSQYESAAGQEVSSRTAQNDLRELVDHGILERVGAGPGTRYTLRRKTE